MKKQKSNTKTIEIDKFLVKKILSLEKEYEYNINHGSTDYKDIGDDAIFLICKLADIIKESKNKNYK